MAGRRHLSRGNPAHPALAFVNHSALSEYVSEQSSEATLPEGRKSYALGCCRKAKSRLRDGAKATPLSLAQARPGRESLLSVASPRSWSCLTAPSVRSTTAAVSATESDRI